MRATKHSLYGDNDPERIVLNLTPPGLRDKKPGPCPLFRASPRLSQMVLLVDEAAAGFPGARDCKFCPTRMI